jgi:uncharacterized protein
MKVRNFISAFVVLLLVPFAIAQTPGAAPEAKTQSSATQSNPDAPSHDEVLEFMRLMHADRQVNMIFDQMQANIRQGMRTSFLSRYPDASPAILEKLDAVVPDFRKYVSVEEVMEVSAKVYAQNLTKRELDAASNFYKSPEGQKLLAKLPIITQQSMREGGALMEAHSQQLMSDVQARMEDLEKQIKAEQDVQTPAKPNTTQKSTVDPKSSTPKN